MLGEQIAVITTEASDAFDQAKKLIVSGDAIGARMALKKMYVILYIQEKMPSKAKNPVNKKPPKRNVVYKSVLNMCKKLKIAPDAYKKQYKTSTTDDWLKERQKLRTAHAQMLKYKKHRQKNPHVLHHLVLNTYKTYLFIYYYVLLLCFIIIL